MWTVENRGRHDRGELRYPGALADGERASIGPLLPPAARGGSKRTVIGRDIANGVMCVPSRGCQWAVLPQDPPPRGTVDGCFRRRDRGGTPGRLHTRSA